MILKRKLNALGGIITDLYPYINNGGCCVYASLVAQELVKRNIDCSGIVTDWYDGGKECIDKIRPYIKVNTLEEWNDNGIALNHVGLEFSIGERKYHYDTEGVSVANKRTFRGNPLYNGRLSVNEMVQLASKRQGWNTHFRRMDIPAIRKFIKYYLKGLTTSQSHSIINT